MQVRNRSRKVLRSKFKRTISPETAKKIIAWQQMLPENERSDALIDDCLLILAKANQPKVDAAEKKYLWQRIINRIAMNEDIIAKEVGKRRSIVRRPILASIIICYMLFSTACIALASGLLPWQITINRDNGYFEIRIVSTKERQNKTKMADTALPVQFVDKLEVLEINVALPKYWPDGYSYSHIEENVPTEPEEYVICYFTYDRRELYFSIESVLDESSDSDYLAAYEMSGDAVRTYTNDNGSYIIYTNNAYTSAVWFDNGYLLSIVGDITEEDLLRIVDSIGLEDN